MDIYITSRIIRTLIPAVSLLIAGWQAFKKIKQYDKEYLEALIVKERYDLLLDVIRGGLADINLITGEAYRSPKVKATFGYNADEMNDPFPQSTKYILEEDRDMVLGTLDNAIQTGKKSVECSFRMICKDKSIKWIYAAGTIVRDLEGVATRLLAKYVDITDLKLLEEEANLSKERYGFAIEAMDSGIWDWNIKTDKIYRTLRFKQILGLKEDFEGSKEDFQSLVHEEDREYIKENLNKFIKGEIEHYRLTYRIYHQNGNILWVSSKAILIRDKNGNPIRVVGGLSDITKLKTLESELRIALNNANTANKAKNEFLTNISHEIRTPINAISGLAYVILNNTDTSYLQKKYLDAIISSSDSLITVIDQILDISQIENKKIELKPTLFQLESFFKNIYDLYSNKASQKGIQLILEYDNYLPEHVFADKGKINQIIVNLLSNAIKFTEEGEINLIVQQKNTNAENVNILIKVKDTGVGIKQEYTSIIFDKFVQVDSSVNRKYNGTGLGLNICSELVKLLGGKISVSSVEGKGTEFIIHLQLSNNPFEESNKALISMAS
jgi:PAS domain S-box-containing protein